MSGSQVSPSQQLKKMPQFLKQQDFYFALKFAFSSRVFGTVICVNVAFLKKDWARMRTVHWTGVEMWRLRCFNKSGRNLLFSSFI